MPLTFHPIADLFPLMEGKEFDELVASIKSDGLIDPMVTLNEVILDGRNRFRACLKAGVEPVTVPVTGADPVRFVIAKNLARRHLTESQCGLVAAGLANIKKGAVGRGHPKADAEISIADAAAMLNVHPSTVSHARTVLTSGRPEEIEAVVKGEAAVSATARAIRAKAKPSASPGSESPKVLATLDEARTAALTKLAKSYLKHANEHLRHIAMATTARSKSKWLVR